MSSFSSVRKPSSAPRAGAANGLGIGGRAASFPVPDASNEAQVGEHVLDLAPLVEARAAHEPVRQALGDEALLDRAGLGVRAVHHGHVAETDAGRAREPLHLRGDERGLFLLVVGLVDDDRVPLPLLGPEVLVLALGVVGDDLLGAVEDRLGRAVVLLQLDDGCLCVVLLEVEDVADVGGAPGVDRLVRVADDADVRVGRRRELAGEHVLGDVRVLELVHEDVGVAVAVALADLLVVAQQLHRADDDVVEVEGVVLVQELGVALVAARRHLFEVAVRLHLVGGGRDQLALCLRDDGEDRARRVLAHVEAVLGADLLHQRHLVAVVVDREAAGDADRLAVDAEDARADSVEGPERDAAGDAAEQPLDALAQLSRRLVREGDGHDPGGRYVLLADQIGDAVGDDAGLAAARPGEDQQRAVNVGYSLELRRVESIEDCCGHEGILTRLFVCVRVRGVSDSGLEAGAAAVARRCAGGRRRRARALPRRPAGRR